MNRLLQWLYHLLAKWSWIGCLLLIPSIGWGASTDSYWETPGTATLVDGPAAIEPGTQDLIIGIRFSWTPVDIAIGQYLTGKWLAAGNQRAYLIWLDSNEKANFIVAPSGVVAGQYTIAAPTAITTSDIKTLVGRVRTTGVLSTSYLFQNGIIQGENTSGTTGIYNGTGSFVIGTNDGHEYPMTTGKIYETFLIIGANLSGVTGTQLTDWHAHPGVSAWMTSGVSTCLYYGGKGGRLWANGKWQDEQLSGTDLTMSKGIRYKLWTPLTLWKWAIDKLGHWRQGAIP